MMDLNKSILNIGDELKIKNPGFCVKTICKKTGSKFFINVCHSKSIQPPTVRLDENDLKELIEKEKYDELSKFTIPLVLEKLETTTDKKSQKAKMINVIVNSKFFGEMIEPSDIYKNYLIYVVIDTINSKFDLNLDNLNSVILKNKKFQPPDGVQQFPKYFNNVMSTKLLDTDAKSSSSLEEKSYRTMLTLNANEKQQKSQTFADISVVSPQQQSSHDVGGDDAHEKYKNIIISLDFDMEMVLIKIKLDLQRIDGLKLYLNDDHILLSSDDERHIIQDFYLPMPMKYEMAKASIKNNILTIQCPVSL